MATLTSFETTPAAGASGIGDYANVEYKIAQSFQLTSLSDVTGAEIYIQDSTTPPTDAITVRIETDSGGLPSGTLAHANATATIPSASVPDNGSPAFVAVTFTSFQLSASTQYHIVASVPAQSTGVRYVWNNVQAGGYASGHESYAADGVWNDYGVPDALFKITGTVVGTTYYQTCPEVVTLADTVLKSEGRVLSEVVTVVDSIIKAPGKVLSEIVTVTDSVIKQAGKILSEVVTVVDIIAERTIGRIFSEIVTVVDTANKSTSRILTTETITVTDTLLKQPGKILSEIITITDSIIRDIGKLLTETVTVIDTAIKNIGRELSEIVTITDNVLKTTGRILEETVIVTDNIIKSVGRIFSETIIITDSAIKSIGKVLSENLTITDTLTKLMDFIYRLPRYIRALTQNIPGGFIMSNNKPKGGVARAVDKPDRR